MRVFLAVVLDKAGRIRTELFQTDSLQEMDEYMQKYQSSADVRKEYEKEINTFLHDCKWFLDNLELKAMQEGRNPRKNFGMIKVGFYGKENKIYFVPAIYQGYQLIKRVNFSNLQKKLEYDSTFKKLIEGRSYLFGKSQNAYDIISLYHRFQYVKYKKMLIDLLISRIKESSKEQQYCYFRCLANMGDLIKPRKIKTACGDIECYRVPKEKTILKRERIAVDCNDEYFMNLYDNDDYDNLFKYYDFDEIERYSKDKDDPLGLRR